MCCRRNANRRTHQALASKASQQPHNNMNLGAVPSENLPYGTHATSAAGVSPIIFDNACQSHCHRRCRGPLILRLGRLIYSRAQEKYDARQLGGGQKQGYIDSTAADIDTKTDCSTLMMPPDYDAAMRAPENEKGGIWVDEKRV